MKDQFGPDIPARIGAMIRAVHPAFPHRRFVTSALAGYEALALLQRGRAIAAALHRCLPPDFEEAAHILVRSLGPKREAAEGDGFDAFLYLPHVFYVADHGLDHFETAMWLQYELTQRFTAEWSLRAYLERHPEATLTRLREWTTDPSPHVRRLVSEGTRPRLPWARRLTAFQRDPRPVLALLERLKDDPELYVRRSVANNLNDIGKDHPGLLVETARRWLADASPERRWIVRHALRSAVKRAEAGALEVLGYGGKSTLDIDAFAATPRRVAIGGEVALAFRVANPTRCPVRALVDLRILFMKADGRHAPKVFKLKTLSLAPGEAATLGKRLSLAQLSTRRHYPGVHRVEAQVNGRTVPLGSFVVVAS